jgi:ribosomal protein S18 acetylase RimI-like enzyme
VNPKQTTITPYKRQYRRQVEDLLFYSSYVHSQLDWQPAEDWINSEQAIIRLGWEDQKLVSIIGVSMPLGGASWIRLAVCLSPDYQHTTLYDTWQAISATLRDNGVQTVSCLALDDWLVNLFPNWGLAYHDEIVTLQRSGYALPPVSYPIGLTLRPTESGDLEQLALIDHSAFAPPWQNHIEDIRLSRKQGSVSTLALIDGHPVGYQISTLYHTGGHLARLAVSPEWQGHHIGGALISELVTQLLRRNVRRLTVNTQASNQKSLHLYQKFGFIPNHLNMPVWTGHLLPE